MKCFFSVVFIILSFTSTFAQVICGTFSMRNFAGNKMYLLEQVGQDISKIDSVEISTDSGFCFNRKQYPLGYYQLFLDDTNKVDIILNPLEDSVVFSFNDVRLQYGLTVLASGENRVLWQYKFFSKKIGEEIKKEQIFRSYIPKGDSAMLRTSVQNEKKLLSKKRGYLNNLMNENPQLFFSKVAMSMVNTAGFESKANQKKHFFDAVDFSDASLIRSNVYPAVIMDYLQKYTDYSEAGFNIAIDTILSKAKINTAVYEFCLNYLLELFNRVGPDVVFDYLINKYVLEGGCSSDNIKASFKSKAGEYARLLPGNKAPEFIINDASGKSVSVNEICSKSKMVILFFWSSHCDFCHKAVPVLKANYTGWKKKGIEIIGISLDTDSLVWKEYLHDEQITWINLCDLKGWDSEIIKSYKIHKTPDFYILDKEGRIISHPKSLNELESVVAG